MKILKIYTTCWIISMLVIIVLVNLNAQEKIKKVVIQSKYLKFEPDEVVFYEINASNDTLTINRAIAAICLLDLLREYSAECYADCTAIDIKYKDWYRLPPDQIFGDSLFYIHQPPLLPGFIKFLDKRFAGEK